METVSVHTSGCQVSVRTQVCRPLPSLFPPPVPPSASPGACTSESELFRFPMIQRSITEDGCSLKKEIDDGYEAGHVIHHFEYYLDWPCKAVTWAGLRERERGNKRELRAGRGLPLMDGPSSCTVRFQIPEEPHSFAHSFTHSLPVFAPERAK